MRRFITRKYLLSTSLLALLGVGLFASATTVGAASFRPHRGRDHHPCAGIAAVTAAASAHVDDVLTDLVAEGIISQDQADTIQERLAEPSSAGDAATPEADANTPVRDRIARCAAVGANAEDLMQAVSDLIGLDPAEIRERRAGGESLAEIAAVQGVSRDDLIATIQTELEANLDEAEASGRITAEEHDERLASLPDRIAKLVDHHRGDRQNATPAATPTSTT